MPLTGDMTHDMDELTHGPVKAPSRKKNAKKGGKPFQKQNVAIALSEKRRKTKKKKVTARGK